MSLFESASLVVTPNGTKASKLYAIKPTDGSGDLSVTRATTATRVNSAGLIESVASNVPRLDYTNGTCPSILVEPQRTNNFTYSEDFSNSNWLKFDATLSSNVATAPDGTTTADKLIVNNGILPNSNELIGLIQVNTLSAGTYTYSIYAKASEFNTIRFRERLVTGSFLTINLNNGTITNEDSSQFISPKAELFKDGWYKISFTTPSSTTSTVKYDLRVGQTGNGTSGIFIWGAQIEAGSYATSYIPTTSAAVTRNADVISKTGISSLIGQTEGTIFVDFNFKQGIESFIIGSGNGSYFNNLAIECYSNKAYITIFNNSASLQGTIETTTLTTGKHRLAIAYNSSQVVAYLDGVSVGTLGAITFPSFNNLYLGNLGSDTNPKNTNINTSIIWKTRLTNAELAELTTI